MKKNQKCRVTVRCEKAIQLLSSSSSSPCSLFVCYLVGHLFLLTNSYIHTHMHTHTRTYHPTSLHIRTHTCTCTYTYTYTPSPSHIHIHTHTHTQAVSGIKYIGDDVNGGPIASGHCINAGAGTGVGAGVGGIIKCTGGGSIRWYNNNFFIYFILFPLISFYFVFSFITYVLFFTVDLFLYLVIIFFQLLTWPWTEIIIIEIYRIPLYGMWRFNTAISDNRQHTANMFEEVRHSGSN